MQKNMILIKIKSPKIQTTLIGFSSLLHYSFKNHNLNA